MNKDTANKAIRNEGPFSIEVIDGPMGKLYEVTGPGLIDEGMGNDPHEAIRKARQYNNVWSEARRSAPLPTSVQEALNSGDGVYRP